MSSATAPLKGQTMIEKIFSTHAGRRVHAGDTVVATVDLAMATDGSGPLMLEYFVKMNGKTVFDPRRVLLVMDHYVPCPNDRVSRLHDSMRAFESRGLASWWRR